jgi:hypothetical protein
MNIIKNQIFAAIAILGCLLLVTLTSTIQAQEVRSRTGFGYYNPRIGGDTGNIFYTDVTIKLSTNFFVGAGFGLSDVFTSYGDEVPLFEGFRTIRNYYHFRLVIDKELYLDTNERHIINVGTGLTYIQLRFAEPVVRLNQSAGELRVGLNESNREQDDAGMLLHAGYGYRVGKFILGFRSELHFLLDIGLGGVIVSPQISLAL